MAFHFDINKAIEVVAVLLKQAPGHRHNYTAILKMLYMADRESIAEIGTRISGDKPFAMDNGPVLSKILNLIKSDTFLPEEEIAVWSKYFKKEGYDISLVSDPGRGNLSEYEVEKLQSIFRKHGSKSFGQLIEESHQLFPEWGKSVIQGSSNQIHLMDILKALGQEDRYEALTAREIEDAHIARLLGD